MAVLISASSVTRGARVMWRMMCGGVPERRGSQKTQNFDTSTKYDARSRDGIGDVHVEAHSARQPPRRATIAPQQQ
eukprot:4214093-Prymnesium_polylepis.1